MRAISIKKILKGYIRGYQKDIMDIMNIMEKTLKANLKSKVGSTLIWVLIMILVLGILITGGLAIASSYSNRSLDQHVKKQAYYTALSTTKSIAEWLDGVSEQTHTENKEQLDLIDELREGESDSTTFDSTVNNSMGTCSSSITYDRETDHIIISSTASYDNATSTVNCEMAYGEGSVGGDGSSSDIKRFTIPKTDPPEIEKPEEVTDNTPLIADENNNDCYIKRESVLDFKNGSAQKLSNTLSYYSANGWKAQYYQLSAVNSENKSVYFKLANGDFPKENSAGEMKNRAMTLYPNSDTFGKDYEKFHLYTEQKDAPNSHIFFIEATEDTTVKKSTGYKFGFTKHLTSTLNNFHIQIDDDGGDDKAMFGISRGLKFTGDSSIYTRRNTYIGSYYRYSGGFYSNYKPKTGEDEYTNSVSTFTPSTLEDGISVLLEGTLTVAENTTYLGDSTVIDGDVIIGGTLVPGKATIKGGNIYVKDGGVLNLNSWTENISCDIFVEPGGRINYTGGNKIFGNIYLLGGYNNEDEKKRATLFTKGQNIRMDAKMITLDDSEIMGGIFLGGETENGKGDGAEIIREGGFQIVNTGTLHAMKGSVDETTYPKSYYCDARVRLIAKDVDRTKLCSCRIVVPEYGNSVDSWHVLGYSEQD